MRLLRAVKEERSFSHSKVFTQEQRVRNPCRACQFVGGIEGYPDLGVFVCREQTHIGFVILVRTYDGAGRDVAFKTISTTSSTEQRQNVTELKTYDWALVQDSIKAKASTVNPAIPSSAELHAVAEAWLDYVRKEGLLPYETP